MMTGPIKNADINVDTSFYSKNYNKNLRHVRHYLTLTQSIPRLQKVPECVFVCDWLKENINAISDWFIVELWGPIFFPLNRMRTE